MGLSLSLVIDYHRGRFRVQPLEIQPNHKRSLIARHNAEIGNFQDIFSDWAANCAFRGIVFAKKTPCWTRLAVAAAMSLSQGRWNRQ
jgi:hypothetical protein